MIVIAAVSYFSMNYSLDRIKSNTVGDGQHETARWETKKEIKKTYLHIPFTPALWRRKEKLPDTGRQGFIVGYTTAGKRVAALMDTCDIHCVIIRAAGVGKTVYFLHPNLEYACASGMSFITTDTKADLFPNFASASEKYCSCEVSALDLHNPTRSGGFKMLYLVNRYMDEYLWNTENISARAKAEHISLHNGLFGNLDTIYTNYVQRQILSSVLMLKKNKSGFESALLFFFDMLVL
jgi:type IV secretion system protein VirD4